MKYKYIFFILVILLGIYLFLHYSHSKTITNISDSKYRELVDSLNKANVRLKNRLDSLNVEINNKKDKVIIYANYIDSTKTIINNMSLSQLDSFFTDYKNRFDEERFNNLLKEIRLQMANKTTY